MRYRKNGYVLSIRDLETNVMQSSTWCIPYRVGNVLEILRKLSFALKRGLFSCGEKNFG